MVITFHKALSALRGDRIGGQPLRSSAIIILSVLPAAVALSFMVAVFLAMEPTS